MEKPRVVFCHGSFSEKLEQIMNTYETERVFLITGKNLFTSSGAEERIQKITRKISVTKFTYSSPNPTIEDVVHCARQINENNPDMILGIGGGTALDIAKAASVLAADPEISEEVIRKVRILEGKPSTPLVLIPTTAGTGSEVTQFAVVYIDGRKFSLDLDFMTADYSLLDASLTISMPQRLTMSTALDALSQSIESYWSVNSTDESRRFSAKSLSILRNEIPNIAGQLDGISRQNLLEASNLSGRAINITRTTSAHAISYALTSKFDIPHGIAVALVLPSIMRENYQSHEKKLQDPRGLEFVRERLNEIAHHLQFSDMMSCSRWIENMMKSVDIPNNLREYNVRESDIRNRILPEYNEERGKNNPFVLTTDDLERILMEML